MNIQECHVNVSILDFDPGIIKDWIIPLVEAGAAIAAIVLVLIVRHQMKQTDKQLEMTKDQLALAKQEMDTSTRPWVGAAEEGPSGDGKGMFVFNFQNFGNAPALNVMAKMDASNNKFTREGLRQRPYDRSTGTILLPNETRHKTISYDPLQYQEFLKINDPVYLGVIIEYQYRPGKSAEYGAIMEFNAKNGEFDFLDEWSEELNK
jgi:hypothetical protein